MHIIVNSDVIHSGRPVATGLPKHIEQFCREAQSVGCVIVIPRTALLENDRHQERLVEEAIVKVENATQTLRDWGVELPQIQAKDVVRKKDFVEALSEAGIRVEVEDASLEDFQDAERRASLHLSPQPPNTKTDEMRDLVIWKIALRLAKKHGKAILVSRDVVHSHDRGAAEANAAGLLRADSLDEALDLLGRESPSAKLVHSILETIWPALLKAELPVPRQVAIRRVLKPDFTSTASGRANANFGFVIDGPEGEFAGRANVRQVASDCVYVALRDVTVNEAPWKNGQVELKFAGELPQVAASLGERLSDLEEIIGRQK